MFKGSRIKLGQRPLLRTCSVLAIAANGILLPASAFAQSAPMSAASPTQSTGDGSTTPRSTTDKTSSADDIVVTGSRIVRNGAQSPTPLTLVTAEDLRDSAKTNVADAINELPAVANSVTPRTANIAVGGGIQGANFLNLRNLGISRTLVLLDGRRVVPATTFGAVDVNLLPTGLIKRVDVVTGGASATYGADAVAGVVNFVLDTKYEGIKGDIQAGVTSRGDAASRAGSLTFGTAFAGGRGHLVANAQYSENDGVFFRDRSFGNNSQIINNPAFTATNGQPRRTIITGAGLSVGTPGGLIVAGPLRGTQFGPNGEPLPFTFGVTSGALTVSPDAYDPSRDAQLLSPLKQGTVFGRVSYDLSDAFTVFGEASYGKSIVDQTIIPYFRLGNIVVRSDNAFIDPVTRARLAAAGAATFAFGKINFSLGPVTPRNVRESQRYVAGANGRFGGDWNWNAYYEHGQVDVDNSASNNPIISRYNLAADAVAGPNGTIVCRSTLTSPTNGCVPYNLFGTQPASPALLAYVTGTARQRSKLTQDVVEASLSGALFDLPAGPLSVAIGGQYRREKASADADAISLTNDFFVGNYKPLNGRVSVKEAFGELNVPVLKDSALGSLLTLNGAVRLTDYSTSGTVTTWKAGFVYEPVPDIRVRLTRSRDIRAPNINDLFLGGQFNSIPVLDPANNNTLVQVLTRSAGNLNLDPEFASTLTGGVVLAPRFLPGLSLSVDYYDVKIRGAIGSIAPQDIVNRCAAGETSFCGFIARNAANQITQIDRLPVNFQQEQSAGIDFELGYRTRLGGGTLALRALASRITKLSLGVGAGRISRAGEVGDNALATGASGSAATGLPDWRGLASLGYESAGGSSITVKTRYIGAAKIESDFGPLDLAGNHVPTVFYVDLRLAQRVKTRLGSLELFGVVDNLFDRDPPTVPSLSSSAVLLVPTNYTLYDTIGREFRVGARFAF